MFVESSKMYFGDFRDQLRYKKVQPGNIINPVIVGLSAVN